MAEVDPDVGPTADINHAVFDVGSVGALTPIGPSQTSNANIVRAQLSSEIGHLKRVAMRWFGKAMTLTTLIRFRDTTSFFANLTPTENPRAPNKC